jgi:hypothetical protein
MCVGAGVETGPPPVAWHSTGAFSSETGVPPSRGRLTTQPRNSVVPPTRPPAQGAGTTRAGSPHPRPARAAEAVRPEPGTTRPREQSCPTSPPIAFRGTPDFIHTVDIDVATVPGRSNNRDVDLVRGWLPVARHGGVITDSARNPSCPVGFCAESAIIGSDISDALTPFPTIMALAGSPDPLGGRWRSVDRDRGTLPPDGRLQC